MVERDPLKRSGDIVHATEESIRPIDKKAVECLPVQHESFTSDDVKRAIFFPRFIQTPHRDLTCEISVPFTFAVFKQRMS
jgi:hypothetical protein